MKKALLFFVMAASAATAHVVSIEGKPFLQTTLMPSIEYSGGATQLTVKVKVLEDDGKPAGGVMVRVSAQSGASLARLRGYGVSDFAGMATVVTAFDVPIVSLARVVLSACTEPAGDCSNTGVYDLRRRWDIEAESSFSQSAGTQVYYSTATTGGNTGVFSDNKNYAGLARLVFNLHSGGSLSHTNQWSAFVEGGGYVLHSTAYGQGVAYFPQGGMYILQTFTNTGLHPSGQFGLQGEAWGRLYTTVSMSLPFSGAPGVLHGQALWAQPVSRGIEAVGGFAMDKPRFGSSSDVYGSACGPLFGLAFSPKRSSAVSMTVLGSWESTGLSTFRDGGGTLWTIPATTSPTVQVSFNYHRGGLAFLTFDVSGQALNTNSKTFSFGTTVTLRDFLRRAPK